MRTGVDEGLDRLVALAGDDDRVLTHVGGQEVSRSGQLALVRDEVPGPGEDPVKLLLVYPLVGEYVSVDPAVLEVDELAEVFSQIKASGLQHISHP